MFFIDFEIAFDRLGWDFIHGSLSFFNFGDDIKRWFHTFAITIKLVVVIMVFPPDSSLF